MNPPLAGTETTSCSTTSDHRDPLLQAAVGVREREKDKPLTHLNDTVKIGYARGDDRAPAMEEQLAALKDHGCGRAYTETGSRSGEKRSRDRPEGGNIRRIRSKQA